MGPPCLASMLAAAVAALRLLASIERLNDAVDLHLQQPVPARCRPVAGRGGGRGSLVRLPRGGGKKPTALHGQATGSQAVAVVVPPRPAGGLASKRGGLT
eukprot:COSAG01_NODE_39745_length_472_cov_2.479893_1_plen_99_part_10